ncbi:hypothetical protein JTE90_003748 [Oedothorax gibbosus]|uniref:Uncharacterized protein n=1 Tax=Oedothorax gibbosus TaxID=931172 RepID=A0AAV6VC28_9ARAC|nr:hypothetical protein JTE90_003748 [Oedothorax gibbosus]
MCTILQLQPKEYLSHIAKQFYLVYCARRKKKKAQYSGRMKSHNKNSLVYRAKKDNSHRLICTFLKLNEDISHIAKQFYRVLCAMKEKKAQYSGRMKSHNKNSLVHRAKKDNSHRLICTFLKLNEELGHIATKCSLVYCARRKKKSTAQYKNYSHRIMCTILQLQPKEDLSHIAKQFYLVYCAEKKSSTA